MGTFEMQSMTGSVVMELRDESGRLIERRQVKNLITNAGRNLVTGLFSAQVQGVPKLSIAVGTGIPPQSTTVKPVSATDTALANELDKAVASVSAQGNVAKVNATLRPTGGTTVQALQEAGIRIEVAGQNVLYNRVTFDVINKGPNMELTLSWEVIF